MARWVKKEIIKKWCSVNGHIGMCKTCIRRKCPFLLWAICKLKQKEIKIRNDHIKK